MNPQGRSGTQGIVRKGKSPSIKKLQTRISGQNATTSPRYINPEKPSKGKVKLMEGKQKVKQGSGHVNAG
jgi:hypothetical protein